MKSYWYKLLPLLLVFALTAGVSCSGSDGNPPVITDGAADSAPLSTAFDTSPIVIPASGVKTTGSLRAWIVTAPVRPKQGYNLIQVFLIDASGQPVSDATVTFSFNMTNMNMGEYTLYATLYGDGRYQSGKAFFSMSGPWRVIVAIARAGVKSSVSFDFLVV
jgi:hypothetical protein